jgi:hypothetical protein
MDFIARPESQTQGRILLASWYWISPKRSLERSSMLARKYGGDDPAEAGGEELLRYILMKHLYARSASFPDHPTMIILN